MDGFVQSVTSLLGRRFNAVTLIAFDYTTSGKGSWLMCGPEALRCCQDYTESNLPSWLWPRHIMSNQITELKTVVFQRGFKRLKPVGNLIHFFQDPLTKYILVTRGCLLDLVSKTTLFMTLYCSAQRDRNCERRLARILFIKDLLDSLPMNILLSVRYLNNSRKNQAEISFETSAVTSPIQNTI
jgi:hypothetical protein